MRPEIKTSLKSLRLHGMAMAWDELTENGESRGGKLGWQACRVSLWRLIGCN